MEYYPETNGIRHGFYDAVNRRTYISIVAAATSYVAHTLSTNRKQVLRKISWFNRTGGAGVLRVGYLTNAAIPVFVQVLPDIDMQNDIWNQLTEIELPIAGNSITGFCADTTLNTGSLGDIVLQSNIGAAAPTDIMVSGEVEEF